MGNKNSSLHYTGIQDVLLAATGVALVLFVWMHMMFISLILIGPKPFNTLANVFEVEVFGVRLSVFAGIAITALLVIHLYLTIRKIPLRLDTGVKAAKHAIRLHHMDTWFWVLQMITAVIIILLALLHMKEVLLDNHTINATISAGRVQGKWLLLYAILLPATEFHVSLGFARIFVKWGLVSKKNKKRIRIAETLLFVIFITLGVASLIVFYNTSIQL